MVALEKEYGYNRGETGYGACNGLDLEVMCAVLKHINASINVKISSFAGRVNASGSYGMAKDVLSKTVDINALLYFLRDYWKLQAYPFYPNNLKIISLKKKVTLVERLRHIITAEMLAFAIVSCCVFIIALKYILQQSTSGAILDFARMFVGASTLKAPRNLSSKIFFLTLMYAVFTVSSYYQGIGRAIDTVPDHTSQIDSVDDLVGSDLKIYGWSNHKEFILNKELRQRYYEIKSFDECNNQFLRNERSVCLSDGSSLRFYVYENQTIHISRKNVMERFGTYTFGEDSPLLRKVNGVIRLMTEGGLVKLFGDRQKRHFKKNTAENDSEKSLDITEFSVEFLILAVGLVTALLAFSLEITYKALEDLSFKDCRRHIQNIAKRIWHRCD